MRSVFNYPAAGYAAAILDPARTFSGIGISLRLLDDALRLLDHRAQLLARADQPRLVAAVGRRDRRRELFH